MRIPMVPARALQLLTAAFCCLLLPATGSAATLQNVGFPAVTVLPSAAPDAVLRYGAAPQQFIERWQPHGDGPHPAVVPLHGGCWLDAYGVDHVRPMATALRDAGFVVIAPESRRLGDPGGGWPGTFEDVAQAVDALVQDEHEDIDRSRIALIGHSAGGHLALWLAARSGLPIDHPLHAAGAGVVRPALVIGLAAITDLERYARGTSSCEQAAAQLMDGAPDAVPGRYALASPLRLARPDTPVILLLGSEDHIVPAEQAQLYAAPAAASADGVAAAPSPPSPPAPPSPAAVPDAASVRQLSTWAAGAVGAAGRTDSAARSALLDDRIAALRTDLAAHADAEAYAQGSATYRTAPSTAAASATAAAPDARVRMETIAGAGHFDPIHPGTPAFRRLRELLHVMASGVSAETPRAEEPGSDRSP